MRFTLSGLLILTLIVHTSAQQRFIKEIDYPGFGSNIRILPTPDNGWIIFSLDSLKMSKFNSCGIPQWSRHLLIPNAYPSEYDVIKTSDGGVAVLTTIAVNSTFAALITKINPSGTILWSKSYEDPTNDYAQIPYTISEDHQGNLVVFSGAAYHLANNPSYNHILKTTSNGTLISSLFYDYGGTWGSAIVTSDNGVLIRTGNTFIKTNNAGNVQWAKGFGDTYYYITPIEVSDGYIYTGYTNTGNKICFNKLDFSGNMVWGGIKVSNYYGIPPHMVKKSNGNFVVAYSKSITEFDKDLNVISQSAIDNSLPLYGKDFCYLSNGIPVITGPTSPTGTPFFAKLNNAYKAKCPATPQPIDFTLLNTFSISNNISFSPYNMQEVSHLFQQDTFSVTTLDICNQPFILDIGNDTLLCYQQSLLIKDNSEDGFDSYLWSTGATTTSITANNSGIYHLRVIYNCNIDTLYDTIKVDFVPPINDRYRNY